MGREEERVIGTKSSGHATKRTVAKMGGLYREEKLGEGPKRV